MFFLNFQLKTFSAFERGNSRRPQQGRGDFSRRMDVEHHTARMSFLNGVLGVMARSPVERLITTLIVSPPSRHGRTGLACASFHNTFTDLSFKWLLLRNDSVERVYCLSGGITQK